MTTTKRPTLESRLRKLGACDDAREWVKAYRSPLKAWRECNNPEWLLWLAGKSCSDDPLSPERRKLALCATEIARSVLHIFEKEFPNDNRVRACIETCERFGRGEGGVTLDDCWAAAGAAVAAWAAAVAAWAAAGAAGAAWAAAGAARAAAGADGAAGAAQNKSSCEIIRRYYPRPPRVKEAA